MPSLPLSRRRLWGAGAALVIERVYGPVPIDPPPMLFHSRAVEMVARPTGTAEPLTRALLGIGSAIAAGRFIRSTTLATMLASTYPSLRDGAAAVRRALDAGDLPAARHHLSAITAWDVDEADGREIATLAVEALAEGVIDAAVAPSLAGIVGGAPGALAYRAAAGLRGAGPPEADLSGRAADMVLSIAERVGLLSLLALRPGARTAVLSGLAETAGADVEPGDKMIAAYAAALDTRLGGGHINAGYQVGTPSFGKGSKPDAATIGSAIALSDRLVFVLGAVTLAGGWLAGRS